MSFNFDQSVEDYKKRLSLVEEYLKENEVNQKELEKLGNYIICSYDKNIKKQNKLDNNHFQVLVNHQKGRKIHIKKKFKRLSLKSPYWNNRTNEVAINLNKERIESNKDILDLIDNQIDSLLNLKQKAKSTATQGVNKSRLFKEINSDLTFLKQSKKMNCVFVKEKGYYDYDRFKDIEINYRKTKVILFLLRNLNEFKRNCRVDSYLFHVLLDIETAIDSCVLTEKQRYHLEKYMEGENTKDIHMKTVELAVKKVMKNL